ncbi:Uncharacterized protein conserved in archaea [Methanocella conradii HZ254]|uniref:Uncharacterized protein conserved in archaea n=1 Tax=Methanocella conradii (strain DSM 24694 / JCM 17849 / CGMCC 1.5162 / HZ254) TaxID=1041930 RepID=H8IAC1_METCZ|nr:DUF2111 domain-containing protein [Methanocella conradii]AFC99595.1 Uncharacterized protein conserved in archaea [Methanocella conradii HZ254]MDI6897441.1 DUF2111 domain-containing protein [Methanocella conradii]
MRQICIHEDSTANDLAPLAVCVHNLFGQLPVTARSKNKRGVRVEGGRVISMDYTGPFLELSIAENRVIHDRPPSGVYHGIPVVVSPIRIDGEPVAAIGVVDVTGSLDLKALMDQYASLQKQMGYELERL